MHEFKQALYAKAMHKLKKKTEQESSIEFGLVEGDKYKNMKRRAELELVIQFQDNMGYC